MTNTESQTFDLTAVRGPVFRPGDDGFDEERAGFQTAFGHRPAVIVGALDAADVQAAVRYAGSRGLPVAVQLTGHGLSVANEGGVLISTRRMTGVRIDADRGTAWVEAGVRAERLIDAAAKHGLAPLSGSSPHVGVVSYTLSGGLGLMARQYGYAADHVRALDVVTADGELRQVTAEAEPDLFWALRGGRDNFGVVTGLEVGLVPVTRLYGGEVAFDGATDAAEILNAYREWTTTLPDEMTTSVSLLPFPDAPWAPEPLRGKYAVAVRVVYTGDPAEGERLVAPLRAIAPALVDSVRELPFTESASIYHDPTTPHGYLGNSALLTELDPAVPQRIVDISGPSAPVPCIVEVRHLGGAVSREPAVPNAVGRREARYILRVLSPTDGFDVDVIRSVHKRFFDAAREQTVGRSLNFVFGESTATEQAAEIYAPADLRRLAELKAVYDPANTFRSNHNIRPA
ncbi:FAD-binding oxidoreductase [Amycolatopsis anabasis]|uniref:FAD-binding oxidoreductase n=1 Tax=Amycolatopsis anabasis TaxID=1840409 RepID=UPI00131E8E86|nr:FAD-binding oxidoreductase [Amycolatopsis anabasis]